MRYRLGVGILLQNSAGLIFAGERTDIRGAWQMPQGGIEKDETPEQAMWRELQEETGVTKASIIYEHPVWLSYDLSGGRGQVQKWFFLKFLGQDSDIHIGAEFQSWQWMDSQELLEIIVSFKYPIYESIFKALPATMT